MYFVRALLVLRVSSSTKFFLYHSLWLCTRRGIAANSVGSTACEYINQPKSAWHPDKIDGCQF